MTGTLSRFCSLAENAKVMAPFLGGPHKALAYLVKSRGNGIYLQEGNYKGINFRFRRNDLSAVKEIFTKQEYAGVIEEILKSKAKPVIRDIGAHIGLFAIWVFSINPDAEVISVEASPGTYKILTANAQKQKFSWHIENKAAWGVQDFIAFADASESTMSHRVDAKGSIKIPTITLTELAAGKTIDLMKIDIEGAEESFLTTNDQALANVQNLVIELHPELCDTDKVTNVLKKYFRTIENLKHGTKKPLLLCRK